MFAYLLRRLLWGLSVLVAVGVLTFLLTYVVPADPARSIAGRNASVADVDRIRHALGLDGSIVEQLIAYFGRVLRGDFGHSFKRDADVLGLIVDHFPATLQLAVAGLAVSMLVGIPLGVRAAAHPRGLGDRISTVLMSLLVAAPAFWLGYVVLFLFAFLPATRLGIDLFPIGQYKPLDLRYLALPALTLGLGGAGYYARITRTAMLDELGLDYVTTARAKGAGDGRVLVRHALRTALTPILSQAGLDIGFFLGGVVVIENVFSWPGIGRLAVDAIPSEDLPLLMGTVLFATLVIVAANLAVDIIQARMDPRIGHA
jgi:peptide/nickel transport system permease protein